MLELLDEFDEISRGGRAHVKLSFLVDKQMTNVVKAIDFYKNNRPYIPAQHILYRLCGMMGYGDIGKIAAYNKAATEERDVCTLLGITTDTFRGAVQYQSFNFKEGECYLSTPSASFIDIASKDWRDMKPVSILYREGLSANLELPHPDSSDIEGFGLIGIDVPQFAAMFHGWKRKNAPLPLSERESLHDFIGIYVLPSLIKDNVRLTYLNMLSTSTNRKDARGSNNIPFAIVDQLVDIYDEIESIRVVNKNQDIHHSNFMKEYPVMDIESMYDAYPNLGNTLVTTHNRWARILASLPIVRGVLDMTPRSHDKDLYLRFRVMDRSISGQRLIAKAPDADLVKKLDMEYKHIYDLLYKK